MSFFSESGLEETNIYEQLRDMGKLIPSFKWSTDDGNNHLSMFGPNIWAEGTKLQHWHT